MKSDDSNENISVSKLTPKDKKFGKFIFVFLLICLCFAATAGKLVYLQAVSADKYREIARKLHESRIGLRAERGSILDAKGRLLATGIQSMSYAVDPSVLKDPRDIARIAVAVEKVTGITAETTRKKIEDNEGSFVWLARGVLPGNSYILDTIKTPGFIKQKEPKRAYLYGTEAAQVIGTTDIDNAGLSGLEKSLDSLLTGTPGYMNMYRDAFGKLRPSPDLKAVPAVHGKNVKLTIDIDIQRIAEFELMNGVALTGAESGTVIAADPRTGKILAMATYPVTESIDPDDKSKTAIARNRAVTDVYEPGSTFKLVTAAAALEEGLIKPSSRVDARNGVLDLGTYKITDDKPLGNISFTEALEYSSNIVFSGLSLEMPNAKLYKYVRDFGFGLTTGIDLPGEVPGKTKKIEEYDEPTKRFLGFGYGIAVTPLQILCAYSAIANGGQLMKPYIIDEIQTPEGATIRKNLPEKVRRVVSEETSKTLAGMLCDVVDKGTGQNAKLPGLKIAGKTGTSQQFAGTEYSKKDYNASFAGWFPADNPSMVMLVVLDKPRGNYHGGAVAAPIFAAISRRCLAIGDSYTSTAKSGTNSDVSVFIPDLCGLFADDARKIAESLGLKLNCKTDSFSIVTSQTPKAGTVIKRSSEIIVESKSSGVTSKSDPTRGIPNTVGMTLRRAMAILHNSGYKTSIKGYGIVADQSFVKNKAGETIVMLTCNY